jgi:hypothetical protein
MDKLIGKECGCEFDMPSHAWPVPGSPAWVMVLAVSMPMIEMCSIFGGRPFWINANKITRIWDKTPNVKVRGCGDD